MSSTLSVRFRIQRLSAMGGGRTATDAYTSLACAGRDSRKVRLDRPEQSALGHIASEVELGKRLARIDLG